MNSKPKLALAIAVALGAGCAAEEESATTARNNAQNPAASTAAMTQSNIPDGDWRSIQRDLTSTRFSPLTEINPTNVTSLTTDWTIELSGGGSSVPLVIDGIMYLSSGSNVVAVDADTGTEVWTHSLVPPQAADAPPAGGRGRGGRGRGFGGLSASARGLGYWAGTDTIAPRIVFTAGSNLVAVDAATGAAAEGFGMNGRVPFSPGYGGTPTIYEHVAIIGAASSEVPEGDPGNPRAFDLRTGEQIWEFQTVPREGEPFNETWGDGWENRGGTNMWAFSAPVDAERGIAYLPIAGPAHNYYGGDRPGANVFGNSIVAVDALTGEYIWHFQTVHHDLWDIDQSSGGALFDFMRNGEAVPAIAYVGKASLFFVLNRVTGEPLIEVEERPVPQGDVPGEWYSPTQPFPVAPPPLARMEWTEDDLVTAEDTTAEHRAACLDLIDRAGGFYNAGPYTPFLYRAPDEDPHSTIQLPGGTGGVNWGGMTLDMQSNIAYANVQHGSLVGWVEDKPEGEDYSFDAPGGDQAYDRAFINGVGPFHSFTAPINGYNDAGNPNPGGSAPCFRPPWGELVAVQADTGEIVWRATLGLNESLPEGKQLVGNSGSAGPTVTAGGLVFVGATSDGRFRAFDSATGEMLWETELDGNGNANPMSFAGNSGKQHVAIVAGGQVNVYSLPD